MNVSDIFTALDDYGFSDASQQRMLDVINSTYWDVCGMHPWPFLNKVVTLTFDGISASPVNLNGGSPTLTDLWQPTAMNRSDIPYGNRIKFQRYDDYISRHSDSTTTGPPQIYTTNSQGTLTFWPIPTSDITIVMEYRCRPAALTAATLEAAILLPKEYHYGILVNGAVYKLDAMEDDTDISAWFQVEYQNTVQRMQDWLTRYQYSDVDIIHPTDSDDLNGGAENWGYGLPY